MRESIGYMQKCIISMLGPSPQHLSLHADQLGTCDAVMGECHTKADLTLLQ